MNPGVRSGACPGMAPNCQAFTLLELMIVCSLAAVLLSLAIPAYRHYLLRAYRSTAIDALLTAAGCQERIYTSKFTYDTTRCLMHEDVYKYELRFEPAETAMTSNYVLIAEPVGAQREDPCGRLSLDQSGQRSISGPAERLRQCWEGR